MPIEFTIDKGTIDLITKVVNRAGKMGFHAEYPKRGMVLDLSTCNANGCPLDFEKLLSFPDFDFSHDISGIGRHINRETGKLEHCFLPRCARS
jgi:hypothetical protein